MADDELATLRRLTARAKRCHDQAAAADDERDDEIRQLVAAGKIPISRIAATVGVKPARIYQIRDRRR